MAGFDASCAEHLNCWEHGVIGFRYAHAFSTHIAMMFDGVGGLETVGLHVGKESYGYVGGARVALEYRLGTFAAGPQLGAMYSHVPSYVADIGPNPSGTMTTIGVIAGYRW